MVAKETAEGLEPNRLEFEHRLFFAPLHSSGASVSSYFQWLRELDYGHEVSGVISGPIKSTCSYYLGRPRLDFLAGSSFSLKEAGMVTKRRDTFFTKTSMDP